MIQNEIKNFWQGYFLKYKQKLRKPTYYLGGYYEEDETELYIPETKPLMMSPVKWISAVPRKQFNENTKQKMIDRARYETDIVADLNVFVDDELRSADCVRQASGFFEMDKGQTIAMSEGYWLEFQLAKGRHHIESFASCALGKTQIPQEYDIVSI